VVKQWLDVAVGFGRVWSATSTMKMESRPVMTMAPQSKMVRRPKRSMVK
jgi:hypothetical protein